MDRGLGIWVIVGIFAVVLVGGTFAIVLMEDSDLWSMFVLVTATILVLVALLLAYRTRKDMRNGVPLEDERTITLNMKAGYRSFQVSLYSFLFLAVAFVFLEDRGVIFSNSELVFILVALMGSMHIALLSYYHYRSRRSIR